MIPAKQRLVLCAPPDVRETLRQSTKYSFIPYGAISPDLVEMIRRAKMDGVLIHGDETEIIGPFMEAADQRCPDMPCLVLCKKEGAEIVTNGWQRVAVNDLTDLEEIEERLERAMFLFPWVKRPALREILGALKKLPIEATSHQRIVAMLHNPEFRLEDLTARIKRDPALMAQLLKIANSGAFARPASVKTIEEAVAVLGSIRLQALISFAWAFFLIDDKACQGFCPKREWEHAADTAEKVRQICFREHLEEQTTDTAVLAAMLHDIGKLLLAANRGCNYATVLRDTEKSRRPCWQTEDRMLGFNHAEIGGCLMAEWGLPLPIAKAVLFHHSEDQLPESPAGLIQRAQEAKRNDHAVQSPSNPQLKVPIFC